MSSFLVEHMFSFSSAFLFEMYFSELNREKQKKKKRIILLLIIMIMNKMNTKI